MQMKKILALALTAVLLLGMLPAQAMATEPTDPTMETTVPATTAAAETTGSTEATEGEPAAEEEEQEDSLLENLVNLLTGGAEEATDPTGTTGSTESTETTGSTEAAGSTESTEATGPAAEAATEPSTEATEPSEAETEPPTEAATEPGETLPDVSDICREILAAETVEQMYEIMARLANEQTEAFYALTSEEIQYLSEHLEELPCETEGMREAVQQMLKELPNGETPLEGGNWNSAFIYFDLYYGDVIINDKTYSGYRLNANGDKVTVTGNHSASNQYYIFQSNPDSSNTAHHGITDVPAYDRVMGGKWGDYITNNTDVLDVIAKWDAEAAKVGRAASPSVPKTSAIKEYGDTQQHYRIDISSSAEANTKFTVNIHDVWSGFQNDEFRDQNGNEHEGVNAATHSFHYRQSGGLSFRPGSKNTTCDIWLYGDNRFGNIHYNVPPETGAASSGVYTSGEVHERKEQLNFIDNHGNATLTVANLEGDSGANHFCSVIGGANNPSYAPGIVISSGTIYAGATERDNCTAIGGGGCGFGGVTIKGGRVTAVTATNGTAIGGGIGDGGNGGAGNVKITGGQVYAYNFGLAIRGTRVSASNTNSLTGTAADIVYVVMPAVAIGSGSSRRSVTSPAKVEISGGTIYAKSIGGTVIGGGSSNNGDGADATINISGGSITAISAPGNVRVIDERDRGYTPRYMDANGNVTTRDNATRRTVSASTSIGGGTVGVPFQYVTEDGVEKIKDQGNGGDCILNITGGTIRAGSIGGGGKNELVDPTISSTVPNSNRYGNVAVGKIGSAQVKITNGNIQGQVIMAKGAEMDCSFEMTGGTIDNATKTDEYVFLMKDGGAVYVENGNATMSGGTIQNCDDAENGGVFYVTGGNVRISGTATIKDSTATLGGAACIMTGTMTMTGGTIENCSATNGGGAAYVSGGNMTIENGTITHCTAPNGGAAYITGGNFTMTHGIMSYNGMQRDASGNVTNTTENGGAVYVANGDVTIGIKDCTQANPVETHKNNKHPQIIQNEATFGGGFYLTGDDSVLTLYCASVQNNVANNAGTGMNAFVDGGTLYHYTEGAKVGEDTNHGLVNTGGNVHIVTPGITTENQVKIYYHSNYSQYTGGEEAYWPAEAPNDYYLNLPYCPQAWSDTMAKYDRVIVGWLVRDKNTEAASVRYTTDYQAIGNAIEVKGENKHKVDAYPDLPEGIHFYALWAPLNNTISYGYSLNGNTITYLDKQNPDYSILFDNQTVPTSYQFEKVNSSLSIPTPRMEGYQFATWLFYADLTDVSNWGVDANSMSLVTQLAAIANRNNIWKETPDADGSGNWTREVRQNFGNLQMVAVFTPIINYEIVGPDNCGTIALTDNTLSDSKKVWEVVDSDSSWVQSIQPVGAVANAAKNYRIMGWYTDGDCKTPVTDTGTVTTVGKPNNITSSTLMPKIPDGEFHWKPTTYYVKIELAVADLTIKKEGCEDQDADQVFLFHIVSEENGVDMQVPVTGNGTVTIKDLLVGKYDITEISDWSWRYTTTGDQKDYVLEVGAAPITFANTRTKTKWLDGSSRATNVFGPAANALKRLFSK